jgi:threonine/homoserine/homoserine lactone efflux protein
LPLPLAFIATAFVIELTPGPNMGYLAILSARQGRQAGLAATFGVAIGLLIVGLAAALGLTAIISTSRWLYEGIRWAGALFLLWLAWEGWRGEGDLAYINQTEATAADSRFFVRGLMTNLLNPKAGIFYVAALPTFVDETTAALPQILFLTVVYVAIATLVHSTIVLLAGAARPWLENEARSRMARRILSLLLAGIAIWLLIATKHAAASPWRQAAVPNAHHDTPSDD